MKSYSIPIVWQSYKRYEVDAENLEEAVTKALKQFLSEPDENYLDNSFEFDGIIEEENPDETYNYTNVKNNI